MTAPAASKKFAEEADHAFQGYAAPWAIIGRSDVALGQFAAAIRAFDMAQAIDARSLEDPSTLHDFAHSLLIAGRVFESQAAYRRLVPRVDLLGTAEERVEALLEAAHVTMWVRGATAAAPRDTMNLDEAVAYLREARRLPRTHFAADVLLSLALVLDRSGAHTEEESALQEAMQLEIPAHPARTYVAASEDRTALEALAQEAQKLPAARATWEAFLRGPGGNGFWAAAARAHLERARRRSVSAVVRSVSPSVQEGPKEP